MKIVVLLSYILVGFSVVTLLMANGALQKRVKGQTDNCFFTCFCLGSTLWSLCFGLTFVQTSPEIAYYLRCGGMVGTFAYLIFGTFLIADWSGIKEAHIKVLKYFPVIAVPLYPFLLKRSNTIFHLTEHGMTYTFASKVIWNDIYNIYCVLTALGMFYIILRMITNKKRKAIRVLGKKLLFAAGAIVLGMVFDTIFPLIGLQAIPGSTIMQFFGTIILSEAFQFRKSNCVTIDNMSKFVYSSVETPVLIYDEKWKLRIVNKSAVEFFSLPEKYEQVTLDKLFELEEGYLQSGIDRMTTDAACLVKKAYCRLVINGIPDRYDDILGYIIIVDDLTDKMQNIEELKQARLRADMANRAKSTFLTQMSHEIRTPLNTILGMDEMILRECDSESIREQAGYIKSAGNTLLGLINDILDLSKLESGRLEIIGDDYSLKTVLHDVLNLVSLKRKDKGLALELEIDETAPNRLYGDELRVKQVLTNVLNNAVKYTEQGTITLRLSWHEKEESIVELVFQIEDTGVGIRREDIKKLFEPYERLDERQNHMIEGSGLGLTITKELLERMHGNMQVESEYGKGSVFTLTFEQKMLGKEPIGSISDKPVGLSAVQEVLKKKEKLIAPEARVLVVDDTVSNLLIIQGLLKETQIRVDMAKSGRDALRMVAKKEYQIIFLDHMMPEMDGIETLQKIKALSDNPNSKVPVIALTANAVFGAKEKYLASGFTDYLSKPVDSALLEQLVQKYLPENMYTITKEE